MDRRMDEDKQMCSSASECSTVRYGPRRDMDGGAIGQRFSVTALILILKDLNLTKANQT